MDQAEKLVSGTSKIKGMLSARPTTMMIPLIPQAPESVIASIMNWTTRCPCSAPQSLPDTDFARVLTHRDINDVHDPDIADKQRDALDAAEHRFVGPPVFSSAY